MKWICTRGQDVDVLKCLYAYPKKAWEGEKKLWFTFCKLDKGRCLVFLGTKEEE